MNSLSFSLGAYWKQQPLNEESISYRHLYRTKVLILRIPATVIVHVSLGDVSPKNTTTAPAPGAFTAGGKLSFWVHSGSAAG